jgi:hypothetical protein
VRGRVLRQINDQILQPLLPKNLGHEVAVALIDATDLEAACSGHKKRRPESIRRTELGWEVEALNADRAVSLSDIRSTPSGSGYGSIKAEFCWRRWSVGWRRPIMGREAFSNPA